MLVVKYKIVIGLVNGCNECCKQDHLHNKKLINVSVIHLVRLLRLLTHIGPWFLLCSELYQPPPQQGYNETAQQDDRPPSYFPPGQPGFAPPGQPGFAPTGQPGYGPPGYGPPGQPGYGPPMQPGYGPPMQPGYGPPMQPGYGPPMYGGQPMYGQPMFGQPRFGQPNQGNQRSDMG